MAGAEVVLIAVNLADIASTNQAEALLSMDDWAERASVEGCQVHAFRHLRMIFLPDGLLFEDHLDRRWQKATGECVLEVVFPSRHVAASGQASLTLHPIGVPHLPLGEHGPYGGLGGHAPPPSSRLTAWWKMLCERAPKSDELSEFDLSLEVTHHGPYLEVPSLFIEVGSTDATWGHEGAAALLAKVMRDGLLGDQATGVWNEQQHEGELVVITLGGGHYAPRANKLGLIDGVWIGHMLASYALPFIQTEDGVEGPWKQSIDAALKTTRQAFPGGDIVFSMDKKAFRGWQRQAIRDHLATLQLPLLTTKQIMSRLSC